VDKEKRKLSLKEREDRYYDLANDLYFMKDKLLTLKGYRSNSLAFKQLLLSIEAMSEQVHSDFKRYKRRINIMTANDEIISLQKSLNRERAKREELEAYVKESMTSSGLFIKYVREKLKI